ncbi:S8 family serine peptidase [Saccharibacillus sp. JS10]|uniref:S8 family serine peptidase n=1 Tax=Saccharibacillus sp. JS10 TaxID=2950552 RepID=UPI00210D4D16|nr:S8 family serine peptidase [Saccharibacillus sp. JS10]MCQ4087445.1 S8 family serine peptidase [Saccharibacillus sp. JS10]
MKWSFNARKMWLGSLAASLVFSTGAASAQSLSNEESASPSTLSAQIAKQPSVSGDSYSRLIVFKENAFPSEAKELTSKWDDIDVEVIPEIGMVRLSSPSTEKLQQAEQDVLDTFQDAIEDTGGDPQLTLPKEDTGAIDSQAALKSIQELESSESDSKASLSQKSSSMNTMSINESATETVEESSPAEVPLYEKWGWDIKEITGDWKSHDIQRGSRDVVIAVVDSGIDASHPDLADSIVGQGRSFVPGIESTDDNLGHGTMVAGSISADGKLLGVGPDLGIVPYKVFDIGGADTSWIVEAIIQASKDDVDVINLSLGTYKSLLKKDDQAALLAYARALIYANLKGVTVVASSGTDGHNIGDPSVLANELGWGERELAVHAPGGLPGVITVSAYNRQHEKAYYSNYGLTDMIAAPAGDYGSTWFTKGELNLASMCLTTYPTNLPQSELSKLAELPAGYEFMIGTSLAVPKVSASAGVLIAEARKQGKTLSPSQVKRALFDSATDFGTPGKDKDFGVGGVNVYEALSRLAP